MSNSWIHRVLDRQSKVNRNRIFQKRCKRRLLMQGLETRQLLAGDVMPAGIESHQAEPTAMVGAMQVANPSAAQGEQVMTAHHQMTHHQMAHPAAMALVSADQATNTVVASGDWSDPAVWENNSLPQSGARIVVPQGLTLTVDSIMTTEFKTIGIEGTLRFATDVDTGTARRHDRQFAQRSFRNGDRVEPDFVGRHLESGVRR